MDWISFLAAFLVRHQCVIAELHRLLPSPTTLVAVADSLLVRYASCTLVLVGSVYILYTVVTRLPFLTYVAALYMSVVGLALAHALEMPVQYEVVLAPLVAAVAGSHPHLARLGSIVLWSATVWTQLYVSTSPALIKHTEAQGLFVMPLLFRREFADILCLAGPGMLFFLG
ncbi:hypothetical protein SDRG_04428 [Saprolegnia diclina VS20]|uniref:Uncharacterized protein n=1 Tax=Saprolegnia diclina (strain VS20) TaxID=1156394 RepID=T0RZR0_SAPDV|nr:hypothetical protein SDRG_04428 [Saprolegnia diclina VS20]EQC37998.1 hypothetical protein SDRG_04428 [Saprolegnia diclina VS20]|eukprot:XP_008608325.1 hypothetical protein SDRG_04428 [Saprolegnia diclina VS20]